MGDNVYDGTLYCDNPKCIQPKQILGFADAHIDGYIYCSHTCREEHANIKCKCSVCSDGR